MTGESNIARKPSEHLSGAGVIVKALQDQGVEVILVILEVLYFPSMMNFLKQITFDIF